MLRKTGIVSGILLTHFLVPAAAAQGSPAAETSPRLEEVVVSARRMDENLQSTPVAVTALTSNDLAVAQIDDVANIQFAAPNLTISTRSPNSASIAFLSIRGQSNLGGLATNDPAIGIYFDNVYIARSSGSLLDLIDTRRVEVLRGPQGTLFGRNTTGGALNILSNHPGSEFGGSVEVRAGDYGLREATGILNVPLNESWAARFVYQNGEHDGLAENVVLNKELNDLDNEFYRASLKYAPQDASWDFLLMADGTSRTSNGQLVVLRGINPSSSVAARGLEPYLHSSSDWYDGYSEVDEWSSLRVRGYSATFNVALGDVDLKSITAWRSMKNSGSNDLDATALPLLDNLYANDQEQFTQEFQLSGQFESLQWITGLFYFTEDATNETRASVFGGARSRNLWDVENTSYAAFAQMYYDVSQQWRLAAGLRYTYDERDLYIKNRTNTGACALAPAERDNETTCLGTREVDFEYVSYMLGVDYQMTPDVFLYGKTSHASLAGGWNGRFGSAPAFEPESVTDVEFGAKIDAFDQRVRLNLAAFYMWQEDVQRTATALTPDGSGGVQPTSFIRNAAEGTIQGIEAELVAAPWSGMTINARLGLLEAEYDKFFDELANGVQVDRSDEDYPQAPELTWSVSATQRFPVEIGEISLNASYGFIDDQAISAPGTASSPAQEEAYHRRSQLAVAPSYGLLNARAALRLHRPDIEVALWGRNLTDEKYYTRTQSDFYTSFGFAAAYPGDPRTFGVAVKYTFGN